MAGMAVHHRDSLTEGIAGPAAWLSLLGLAVLPTIVSTATLAVATRLIGATKASVLGVFEPVTAILVGAIAFGEPVTTNVIIGIVLTMAAITFMVISFSLTFAVQYRGVEQLVARRAHNPEAGGSSPSPATKRDNSFGLSFFVVPKSPIERTARAILGPSRQKGSGTACPVQVLFIEGHRHHRPDQVQHRLALRKRPGPSPLPPDDRPVTPLESRVANESIRHHESYF